jgi:hypothetical protein
MPVIIDCFSFLLLLSLVAICSKNSNQYQIAVSDFPLQLNSKADGKWRQLRVGSFSDWRHSFFVSVKILRARILNATSQSRAAGQFGAQTDEARNRLPRPPATTIEPKIRAQHISATAPVKYKKWSVRLAGTPGEANA